MVFSFTRYFEFFLAAFCNNCLFLLTCVHAEPKIVAFYSGSFCEFCRKNKGLSVSGAYAGRNYFFTEKFRGIVRKNDCT